jgi:hypothetical protein
MSEGFAYSPNNMATQLARLCIRDLVPSSASVSTISSLASTRIGNAYVSTSIATSVSTTAATSTNSSSTSIPTSTVILSFKCFLCFSYSSE